MKKPDLVATVIKTDDGMFGLTYSIPRMFQAVLAGIGEGVVVRNDIKKWYKKRTTDQNSTAWGPDYALILEYITKTTGDSFTPEELHLFHKKKFLEVTESDTFPGLYKLGSTKDLDTVGFAKFRDDYCDFWAMIGLYIPDPDPTKKRG